MPNLLQPVLLHTAHHEAHMQAYIKALMLILIIVMIGLATGSSILLTIFNKLPLIQ